MQFLLLLSFNREQLETTTTILIVKYDYKGREK